MYATNPEVPVAAVPCALLSHHSLADFSKLRWYAAYTRSRHEKQVSRMLEGKSVETFLPMYESVHRWNDRSALVSQPIFPGYVFVRICLADRVQVLSVPGVVNLVGAQDRPCPVPDEELAVLRACWERRLRMEPYPYLTVGRRVRIKRGSLVDMEGILLRKKNRFRLVLSINLITRSVAVEVDAADVVPAAESAWPNHHTHKPLDYVEH